MSPTVKYTCLNALYMKCFFQEASLQSLIPHSLLFNIETGDGLKKCLDVFKIPTRELDLSNKDASGKIDNATRLTCMSGDNGYYNDLPCGQDYVLCLHLSSTNLSIIKDIIKTFSKDVTVNVAFSFGEKIVLDIISESKDSNYSHSKASFLLENRSSNRYNTEIVTKIDSLMYSKGNELCSFKMNHMQFKQSKLQALKANPTSDPQKPRNIIIKTSADEITITENCINNMDNVEFGFESKIQAFCSHKIICWLNTHMMRNFIKGLPKKNDEIEFIVKSDGDGKSFYICLHFTKDTVEIWDIKKIDKLTYVGEC